jgi:hypothetical protein
MNKKLGVVLAFGFFVIYMSVAVGLVLAAVQVSGFLSFSCGFGAVVAAIRGLEMFSVGG